MPVPPAGLDGLPPRRREARDDRAGELVVLGRLDDVRAEVVRGGAAERGALEAGVVGDPLEQVAPERERVRRLERAVRGGQRLLARALEAERQRLSGRSSAVITTLPEGALSYCVSARAVSNWVSPSLAVPA